MNNQKLTLGIGFLLLGIISYQGYLLYQKDAPEDTHVIEKKIVKKDTPQINIHIDKSMDKKVANASIDTPSTANLSEEERHKVDQENIEKSIQDVFKSIFASKEVQDGITQFKEQAQTGMKELQKELENLPAKIENMQKELKDDPFFSQLLGQLKGFGGKQLEDKGDHYYLQMEVPGGKESKVDIQTKANFLTIMIDAKDSQTTQTQNGTVSQSASSKKQEILVLPSDAFAEKLQTKYEHGILTITIPKVQGKTSL